MKINKNLSNGEITELLRAVAASYQIANESKNRFKIIAYNRAADAVEHLGTEVKDIWDDGNLDDISGIGPSIAGHLSEIFKTGKSKHFEEVLKGVPKAALALLELATIGPKKAYRLAMELNLPDKGTLEALKRHVESGDVAKMEGFGEQSQSDILSAIEEHSQRAPSRMLLSEAESYANGIVDWMNKGGIGKIDALGSLRRKAPTVGDVDLAASSNDPNTVIARFVDYPGKARVINQGEKSASILLPPNIRADLKVESPKTYGALLQHFTGSKHHNVALREYSLKSGMSLSEHGIKVKGKLQTVSDEKEFYSRLGMDWIPPEIREGVGEIEVAIKHKLPKLVELSDIKGDLQIHSDFDIETSHDVGASTMEEVIQKAGELNYEYIAFTEHNPSQKGHSQAQITELLKSKRDKITQLNESVNSMKTSIQKVFNSLEVDMMPSGQLPLSKQALEMLDFALVSIHSSFKLSRKEMTKRVLNGLDHPKVKIFAHPTARLLEKREGVELDWDKIFDFCLRNNKWIEINADPHRLDLPDFLIREAVKKGVMLTLGTDSHHKDGLENMRYGVSMARRGWAEKKNIINTMPLRELEKLL